MACHQLGNKAHREIPEGLGTFPSSVAAWDRRIQSGQAGAGMSGGLDQMGRQRALKMFADWTDRIAAGEVPPAPPRPQGLERNVVDHDVGLGRSEGLPARRRHDRPAEPDRERERPDVRSARGERRLPARSRSEDGHESAACR